MTKEEYSVKKETLLSFVDTSQKQLLELGPDHRNYDHWMGLYSRCKKNLQEHIDNYPEYNI